ncbi:large subunit of alpha-aminoadipate reductase [Blastocladiella emersonii ATCC 22665]|nr:large subunit of alpha-aminoadipate reductase [Blastocladiella emersonii ATCC 22665]
MTAAPTTTATSTPPAAAAAAKTRARTRTRSATGGTNDVALLDRWRERLRDLTELQLPTDYPRTTPLRIVEADEQRELPIATTLAILQLSLQWQAERMARGSSGDETETDLDVVSPFQVLLGAFAVLLHRYTGEEDVSVGSSSIDGEPVVLRLRVRPDDSFKQVVERVCDVEREALHDPVPFTRLASAVASSSASASDGYRPALFKVRFFNMPDTTAATLAAEGTATDLTIFISTSPSLRRLLPIHVRIAYNTCLYAPQRIRDMADQLLLILDAALRHPDSPVAAIDLVTPGMRPRLPDPRADLGWDQWHGAIHDIFSRNARAHPDRTCAVERTAKGGIERVFSYRHILEASNAVAHYLLAQGVQREDVVMLYSYRGVDLMVAIMGVLKAGCTFSVIDPAYPPQRQIIYLSVARPRALIVLSHAGTLDPAVRAYVSSELDVVCEIPDLALGDNGVLTSSCLAPHLADGARDPAVVVGPDSIGTLSFTSGSTGIPKGVRGRHFSLTHFYPWMQARFALSETDRFTMLSGIAHDPIQRDIFTPLFLGASLYVPTAEDIGTPGQLAQWMADHAVTVTHLTPAMGQLLTACAATLAPIPSLRAAFFVGDILTKRDVARLQHLAPNCTTVNMYGTTETQRAVSYLAVPPRATDPEALAECKDVLPAGQGMHHVQLLVVNARGNQCGVGEVGELYVRSSGLAEGYLGLPDATHAKFLPNPFGNSGEVADPQTLAAAPYVTGDGSLPYFRGARDRMYRTGDLGRYRPDGQVECSGRADDQVKIRGFRIELGEIDMYLSQHPAVRENVTLVRRDKDEEQTLVSYLVLHDEAAEDGAPVAAGSRVRYAVPASYAETAKAIREFLRSKLPAYAVPAVLCPLRHLPLTPNGKIDKNALPYPDTSVLVASQPPAQHDTELSAVAAQLRDLWAALLGVPAASIAPTDNFFEIGGHSVLATRLTLQVRRHFGVADAPLALVFDHPVLGDMAEHVDALMSVLGPANAPSPAATGAGAEFNYAAEAVLPDDIAVPAASASIPTARPRHVLVTGATGFLGAFIVAQLVDRARALDPESTGADFTVTCVARAGSDADALARVTRNLQHHVCWSPRMAPHVRAVAGDLALPRWGLSEATWGELAASVDAIVHNGAMVHWVYPYAKLAPANVAGTVGALRLAVAGEKVKPVHFVSSTSVLDTPHYAALGAAVAEDDALAGSRTGLRSGYAQTKWVAERLCAAAADRGVPVTVVRPGYIVGHSASGVTNADDFLWRLVKGCIELGQVPDIRNAVNMCPVDYVAECVVALVLGDHHAANADAIESGASSPTSETHSDADLADAAPAWSASAHPVYGRVYHTYNGENFRFSDLLAGSLAPAWPVATCAYLAWRSALLTYTLQEEESALYPLLHFVLDDLPTSTRAPALDDAHTFAVLTRWRAECRRAARRSAGGVSLPDVAAPSMRDGVPRALAYLVAAGFLPKPTVAEAAAGWPKVADEVLLAIEKSGAAGSRTSAATAAKV